MTHLAFHVQVLFQSEMFKRTFSIRRIVGTPWTSQSSLALFLGERHLQSKETSQRVFEWGHYD